MSMTLKINSDLALIRSIWIEWILFVNLLISFLTWKKKPKNLSHSTSWLISFWKIFEFYCSSPVRVIATRYLKTCPKLMNSFALVWKEVWNIFQNKIKTYQKIILKDINVLSKSIKIIETNGANVHIIRIDQSHAIDKQSLLWFKTTFITSINFLIKSIDDQISIPILQQSIKRARRNSEISIYNQWR